MDLRRIMIRTRRFCGQSLTKHNQLSQLSLARQIKFSSSPACSFRPLERSYVSSASLEDKDNKNESLLDAQPDVSDSEPKHPYKSLLPWKSRHEFHQSLLSRIVLNQNGLIVVNKPYGVGVKRIDYKYNLDDPRMGRTNLHLRGVGSTNYTLEGAIPFLRDNLQMPGLVLIKSAEKQASGLAIFAENEKMSLKVQKNLMASKAQSFDNPLYKYHVVCAGVPYTKELSFKERVGIQLKSSPLSEIKQPVIVRQFSKNSTKRREIRPVHVVVNIMRKSNYNTTLLEIQTTAVKWNFLRIYCADILMPILGDHLYSSRVLTIMGLPTKIDPTHLEPGTSEQKLDVNILQALDRLPDSILVPPHIHLYSMTLKNFIKKGESLTIQAPHPDYFKYTCEKLRLY